jgi:uncharacterized protein YyaL (SSP411 family)
MAVDLAGYLARRMTAPEGGFYTAEDAGIEGKEGESYLWTRAEITEVLGSADADRFFGLYELTPRPNEPNGPGVLRNRKDLIASDENRARLHDSVAELAPLRTKLLEVRDRRSQPARDDKIVVALNGLAIAGLARAGMTLGEKRRVPRFARASALASIGSLPPSPAASSAWRSCSIAASFAANVRSLSRLSITGVASSADIMPRVDGREEK